MSAYTPFTGRRESAAPMRVLRRFTKPAGHWAEIRERNVTSFRAIEFLVFVDGSLLESQMFHGSRVAEYPSAFMALRLHCQRDGWAEEFIRTSPPS